MSNRTICTTAFTLTFAATGFAQAPRLLEVHRPLPVTSSLPLRGDHVADINADGLNDLVLGATAWLQLPDERFEKLIYTSIVSAGRPIAQTFADLDADGDLDRIIVTSEPWLTSNGPWYDVVERNDGTGDFRSMPQINLVGSGGPSTCVTTADVDGDGDLDIVTGSEYLGPTPPPQDLAFRVFINNGGGVFTLEASRSPMTSLVRVNALAFLDIDDDGDQDLYVANDVNNGASDRLYENDGSGFFTTVSSFTNWNDTVDLHAADFDQDGDQDLLLVDVLPSGQNRLRYLNNTGSGLVAVQPPPPSLPSSSALSATIEDLVLGDWNTDGRIDYAVRTGGTSTPCAIHAFVGTGTAAGSFAAATQPPIVLGACYEERPFLVALDYELDGDTDLIVPGTSTSTQFLDSLLLRNIGDHFEPARSDSPTAIPDAMLATSDLNGDGIEDLIVSPTYSRSGEVWLGTGTDAFLEGPSYTFGGPGSILRDIRCADVTGDGLVDVICANEPDYWQTSGPSRVYRNTGTSLQLLAGSIPFARQIAAADFDGDGDVDLFLDNMSAFDELLVNDGSGSFTSIANAIPLPAIPIGSFGTDLFAVDFDGDGDLDVAGHGVDLLENDGTGVFMRVVVAGAPIAQPLVADFDGDGDPDVFLPNRSPLPNNHTLMRNDGGWSFTSLPIPATKRWPNARMFANDFDNDGRIDIVGQTFCYPDCDNTTALLLHNLGGLSFAAVPAGVTPGPDLFASSAARLDVDGDGDTDLVWPGDRSLTVFRNLHHQLAWRTLPRVGGRIALDIYGRPGEAFALGLAPQLAASPIPVPGLGVLHLDPMTMQISDARSIGPEGRFGYVVDLPNTPQLVGLKVFAQTLYPQLLGNLESIELRAR